MDKNSNIKEKRSHSSARRRHRNQKRIAHLLAPLPSSFILVPLSAINLPHNCQNDFFKRLSNNTHPQFKKKILKFPLPYNTLHISHSGLAWALTLVFSSNASCTAWVFFVCCLFVWFLFLSFSYCAIVTQHFLLIMPASGYLHCSCHLPGVLFFLLFG